ncbi:unnamed protein product [Ilex paraguariensis]|uniref:Uncharacterized protein n=1 Tax=Ilex paraguariensis TaxID=185542 RepID=A0ABC8SUT8_9AQUA
MGEGSEKSRQILNGDLNGTEEVECERGVVANNREGLVLGLEGVVLLKGQEPLRILER